MFSCSVDVKPEIFALALQWLETGEIVLNVPSSGGAGDESSAAGKDNAHSTVVMDAGHVESSETEDGTGGKIVKATAVKDPTPDSCTNEIDTDIQILEASNSRGEATVGEIEAGEQEEKPQVETSGRKSGGGIQVNSEETNGEAVEGHTDSEMQTKSGDTYSCTDRISSRATVITPRGPDGEMMLREDAVDNLLELGQYLILDGLLRYVDTQFNRPELSRDIVKYLLKREPPVLDLSNARLFRLHLGCVPFWLYLAVGCTVTQHAPLYLQASHVL